MKAISVVFNLGVNVSIPKLVSSVDYLSKVHGVNMAYGEFEHFGVFLFPSGLLRIVFHGSGDFSKILPKVIVSLSKLISDVNRVFKKKIDVSAVAETQREEELDPAYYSSFPPLVERGVNVRAISLIFLSSLKLKGDFSTHRLMDLAGEEMGAQLVKENNPQDSKALMECLKKFFSESGLGDMEYEVPKACLSSPQKPDFIIKIYSCPFSGLPQTGEPLCDLSKGIIRAAYIHFIQQFNVFVNETKCWGLGDDHCEFEIGMRPV